MGWITSSNRKVHQRALNKVVRKLNDCLLADDLWRGRFLVRQGAYQLWYEYEDHSGWELYVTLELHDRLTGKVKTIADTVNHWCMWGGSHLFWAMNEFIAEDGPNDANAWVLNPRPGTAEYKTIIDNCVKKGWPFK